MGTDIRTPEVEAIVNIDGKQTNFVRLRISQEMGEHHDFEVLVDFKSFDTTFHDSPEVFMQKTNTKVVIDIQHADQPGNAYVFSGMVTNIRMIAEDGMFGGVLFIGKSKTIELERGPVMQTYSHTNLVDIIKTITGGTMNLDVDNDPAWIEDIDFAIQYMESDWQFLQRLCNQYIERMYYTGLDLVIGPHPEFKTVNLVYDKELRSFEISSRLLPNKFSTYYYKREEDAIWRQDSPASIDNATNLLNIVSKRSDNLNLLRKPTTPATAYVPDMGSLIEHAKRRKVAEGARMVYARGACKTCDVRIGRIISVKMPDNMGGTDLGRYRVYSVVHEFDQNGRYKCNFEAIPADLEYIPNHKVPTPVPNPIEVVIWDNVDPEGQGRVRVGFPFDERTCDAWIPVMTFDAGTDAKGSGNVKVNRGTVWIPEEGDRCLLGFLDGQGLSHPYIMGSMFHGKIAENQGGGKGNYIKTITTKSGHTLKFDDTEGKEKIQMYDKNGDLYMFDTAEKSITVSAPEKITIISKEVNIIGSDLVYIKSEKMIKEESGENIEVAAEQTLDMQGKTEAKIHSDTLLNEEAPKTTIRGTDQIEMEGNLVNITGTTVTNVKGDPLNLN